MINRAIPISRTEYAEAATTEPTVNQMQPIPITIFRPTYHETVSSGSAVYLRLRRDNTASVTKAANKAPTKAPPPVRLVKSCFSALSRGWPRSEWNNTTRDNTGVVPEEDTSDRSGENTGPYILSRINRSVEGGLLDMLQFQRLRTFIGVALVFSV
jgi:hypothetical protein